MPKAKIKNFLETLNTRIFGWSLIVGHKTFHFGPDKWWLFWDGHREDKDPDGKIGWGIVFAFRFGAILRPIPKLWKWQRSNRFPGIAPAYANPWTSGDHWFNITIPWLANLFHLVFLSFFTYYASAWFVLLILPSFTFLSIAYKEKGLYIGVKDLQLDNTQYLSWMPYYYFVTGAEGLAWSASIRRSRNK